MTEPTLTPSRLWKRMTSDQRLLAARAFWSEEQATDDQVQAVMLISQQKKFRPKTVLSLNDDRKAKHLASLATLPDALAARALVVYHLAEQRPMMAAFLDALGIAHENGLIQDDAVKPDSEKIAEAVKTLTGQFPRENVTLYLDTLLCQDPETWAALADLPDQTNAPAPAETTADEAPAEEATSKQQE
jgi:hypothetical protein